MIKLKVGDQVRGKSSGLLAEVLRVDSLDLVDVQYVRSGNIELRNPAHWYKLVNKPADLYPGEVACVDEKTGQVEYVKAPGGTKHDNTKPDLSLLPMSGLEAIVRALEYGQSKYGRNNFRKGFESHRLIGACLRHVHAWNEGEDNDPESGVSHLGHAAATLVMLLTNLAEGKATDTRYKK